MQTTPDDRQAILNALAALQALSEMAAEAKSPPLAALAAIFEAAWSAAVRIFDVTEEEYQDVVRAIEEQIEAESVR